MADKAKSVPYICESCFHWAYDEKLSGGPIEIGKDTRRGVCFGCPPIPRPIVDRHTQMQTGQANMRPLTLATERACGAFIPRDGVPFGPNDLNG
jgi:hypothetical protein